MTQETMKKLLCELICEEKRDLQRQQDQSNNQKNEIQEEQPNGENWITVMTNGFIYVGFTKVQSNNLVKISNAKNIRRWGTTKGLGELVNGPLTETKYDESGEILCPFHAVIHFIKCKKNW